MEASNTTSSSTPQIKVEKGPELSQAPVSPTVNNSERVEAIPVQNVPTPAGKKGGMGCFAKGCIASCVVLLLCCCVTIVLAVAAPSVFAQMVASGSKGPDQSLTRITRAETPILMEEISNTMPELVGDDGLTYSVTITEKQFLASIVSGMGTDIDPNALGLDFENNRAKFEIDFSVLAAALKNDPQFAEQISFKPEDVKGVYITMELSNDSEGNLVFENLSLGNTVLDPIVNIFFTPEVKQGLSKSLQDAFSGDSATAGADGETAETDEMSLRKVEFLKDTIKMSYEMNPSFTPEIP